MKKLVICLLLIFMISVVYATTYEDAELAINNSKLVLGEFQKEGFSVVFINDTLIQAEIVLEQAKYAEILRNSSLSEAFKQEARSALRLVDWKNISYDSVFVYTSLVDNRRIQAYEIYDSLRAINKKIVDAGSAGMQMEGVNEIYLQANRSFYEDRYEEAFDLIEKTNLEIERVNSETAKLSVFGRSMVSFVRENWAYIILSIIIVLVIVYFCYKRVKVYLVRRRINKMKTELIVLRGLLIKNQEDRFRENKISALVYNIRAKKYEERINGIKEVLPVLESKLKKGLNKKEDV